MTKGHGWKSEYDKEWYNKHRECQLKKMKEWREANPEKMKASKKQWNDAHKKEMAEYSRKRRREIPEKIKQWKGNWNSANPEKLYLMRKRYHYKKKYGITLEELEEMVAKQKSRCLICDNEFKRKAGRGLNEPIVDHDHIMGKIRGLLCYDCNTGLGKFHDNPNLLGKAKDYLTRGSGN